MNVNSRGHNLDTRIELFFLIIKHPPGLENPVGVHSFLALRIATRSTKKHLIACFPELNYSTQFEIGVAKNSSSGIP